MSFHSPKYAKKRRKKTLWVFFVCLLCLVALFSSVIFFAHSSFFKIDTITVNASPTLPIENIKKMVFSMINDSSKNIEKAIHKNFMEIDTVSVRRSGFRELTISVEERLPVAVVCSGFREDISQNKTQGDSPVNCYFSDKHGYIFRSMASSSTQFSPSISRDSYTHYYVPTDKEDSLLGATFIEEKRFQELEKFVKGARLGGLFPLGILIGQNGEYEMYMKNKKVDSEITVYFDDKAPFGNTLSNLLTFWQNLLQNARQNSKSATTPIITTQAFDYIDLRFGNAVYYIAQ